MRSVPEAANAFGVHFAYFVKLLNQLSSPSYSSSDHEISGVADPFLQTSLILLTSELARRFEVEEAERKSFCAVLEQLVSTPHRKGESVSARVSI